MGLPSVITDRARMRFISSHLGVTPTRVTLVRYKLPNYDIAYGHTAARGLTVDIDKTLNLQDASAHLIIDLLLEVHPDGCPQHSRKSTEECPVGALTIDAWCLNHISPCEAQLTGTISR